MTTTLPSDSRTTPVICMLKPIDSAAVARMTAPPLLSGHHAMQSSVASTIRLCVLPVAER